MKPMHVWVDYMCMPQLTSVKKETCLTLARAGASRCLFTPAMLEVITHTDTHQLSEKIDILWFLRPILYKKRFWKTILTRKVFFIKKKVFLSKSVFIFV